MQEFDQVANTIFNLGECYGSLYAAATNFNRQAPIGKVSLKEDVYIKCLLESSTWWYLFNIEQYDGMLG